MSRTLWSTVKVDQDFQDIRIVDWRVAPVARDFYRYREGDRFEETFPGRVAEGVVVARRVLVIQEGALWRIVGDGVLLERGREGRWRSSSRAALSLQTGGAETAARPGILGVGIAGVGAGDLISEGVLAVEMGANAFDLAQTVHPHPTLSETLMEAAEAFYGHSAHIFTPKKP